MAKRVAVVLLNLGGPDGPAAVGPFLFNLFRDRAIVGAPALIRFPLAAFIALTRTRSAQANYDRMGGSSPLLAGTQAQAEALEAQLGAQMDGADVRVFIAMRYWKPLSDETARAVEAFAPDEIVLLPLYPQYSTTTTGSSVAAWSKACRSPAPIRTICCYPTVEGLAEAHANRIEAAWIAAGRPGPVRLLFSAHGLPESVVAGGDPYQAQIEATAAAVAARLSQAWDWRVCYQSRVGPMKWVGPSTPEAIEAAAAEGLGVVITPIAFVSEHIETLVELDHDYALAAEAAGCLAYVRAPALGIEPAFIGALADLVARALDQKADVCAGGDWNCPAVWSKCPHRAREARA